YDGRLRSQFDLSIRIATRFWSIHEVDWIPKRESQEVPVPAWLRVFAPSREPTSEFQDSA
ncbi:MAG: hypothetical protein ACK5ZC_11950, partial [Pirellulaceae bacterium]